MVEIVPALFLKRKLNLKDNQSTLALHLKYGELIFPCLFSFMRVLILKVYKDVIVRCRRKEQPGEVNKRKGRFIQGKLDKAELLFRTSEE
jgi:hypothetical protein